MTEASLYDVATSCFEARADQAFLHYFDRTFTGAEIRADVDAFADALLGLGVEPGDRVAIQTQNLPQFVVALIATWAVRGVVVPLNPMYKEREAAVVLDDCAPTVVIAQDDLYRDVIAPAIGANSSVVSVTTSALDYLSDSVPAPLRQVTKLPVPAGAHDLVDLIVAHRGAARSVAVVSPADVALLVYTSGTTGPPKGAVILQRNLAYTATTFKDWAGVGGDDVVAALAPFFHITGMSLNLGVALAAHAQIVLAARFEPDEALRLLEMHGATYTIAAITAFIALMNSPGFESADLRTFQKVFSGGAPIAASTAKDWEARAGSVIRNAYGLSETASVTHAVPVDVEPRIDPESGALSIGLPIPGTSALIFDDKDRPVLAGDRGEIVIAGRGVMQGYWNRPKETAKALIDGRLYTGDVGFVDANGWFYIVDRTKDIIIVSGYKVWPREVEDVLYQHPAVREAAVVGVPDEYQGEAVKAFVSCRPGVTVDAAELIEFCRERMAAYKRPKSVEFIAELPKTASGKILRRELRGSR